MIVLPHVCASCNAGCRQFSRTQRRDDCYGISCCRYSQDASTSHPATPAPAHPPATENHLQFPNDLHPHQMCVAWVCLREQRIQGGGRRSRPSFARAPALSRGARHISSPGCCCCHYGVCNDIAWSRVNRVPRRQRYPFALPRRQQQQQQQ